MEIFVQTCTGGTCMIRAKSTDTIAFVKSKIGSKKHVVPRRQRLFFEGNELTEESHTLSDCRISKHCTLHMFRRVAEAEPIFVATLIGRVLIIRAELADTVGYIKSRIEEILGTTPSRQRLLFRGKRLDDDRTLGDYEVRGGSTLNLVECLGGGQPIFIKAVDETFRIPVYYDETIKRVKDTIENIQGIPAEQQHLEFGGVPLEDGCTLSDYEIKMDSTLCLTLRARSKMKVFVETRSGKKMKLEVEPSYRH